MIYQSAFEAITCILKSCDPDTQEKIIKEITKYQEWDKVNGIPSDKEVREMVIRDIKKNLEARIKRNKKKK